MQSDLPSNLQKVRNISLLHAPFEKAFVNSLLQSFSLSDGRPFSNVSMDAVDIYLV